MMSCCRRWVPVAVQEPEVGPTRVGAAAVTDEPAAEHAEASTPVPVAATATAQQDADVEDPPIVADSEVRSKARVFSQLQTFVCDIKHHYESAADK